MAALQNEEDWLLSFYAWPAEMTKNRPTALGVAYESALRWGSGGFTLRNHLPWWGLMFTVGEGYY